jgi:predicted DNA-binding transcriptional regulator AlpA
MPPTKSVNVALAAHARAAKNAAAKPFSAPKKRKGERLVFKTEVLDRIGKSYPWVWSMMRRGLFPRSVMIGANVAWYESEIDAYLAGLKRTVLKGDAA